MHCKSLWIKASAKCINVNVLHGHENASSACVFKDCGLKINRFVLVNFSVQRQRSSGNTVFLFSCLIDINKFFEKHL